MLKPSEIGLACFIRKEEYVMLKESNPAGTKHDYDLYLMIPVEPYCLYHIKTDRACTKQEFITLLENNLKMLAIKEYISLTECNIHYMDGTKCMFKDIADFCDMFRNIRPFKRTEDVNYYDITRYRLETIFDSNFIAIDTRSQYFAQNFYLIHDYGKKNNYALMDFHVEAPVEQNLTVLCQKYGVPKKQLSKIQCENKQTIWFNPTFVNNYYAKFPDLVKSDPCLDFIAYDETLIS